MDLLAQSSILHAQRTTMPMQVDRHDTPAVMLRHRMFPRAMAWDLHQTSQHSPEYHVDDRLAKAARREWASSPRSSSPFSASERTPSPPPPPFAARPPSADSRERLFRTIGKWLDNRDEPPQYQQAPPPQRYAAPLHHQHQEQYPSPPRHSSSSGLYDMVKLGSAIHSPSSTSSPTYSHSSGKKRQRGPSGSTAPPVPSSSSTGGVARPGMSTSSAKRCSVDNCAKIAVSKGLCRGHGGGRRCTFAGCTKCAQSRSPFCWAHGGGKRCEAPNCRRSRKTKRFCVDHVEMEATVPLTSATDSDDNGGYHSPHAGSSDTETSSIASSSAPSMAVGGLHLPRLSDALKRAVPGAVARASSVVTLPQSADRLWPTPAPIVPPVTTTSRPWL